MTMEPENTPRICWKARPDRLKMGDSEVHVWRANLSTDRHTQERLAGCLSPAERSRAERFVFPRDRHYWAACHGILREILGLYLNEHPRDIEIVSEPGGKPRLRQNPSCGEPLVKFNLSHSNGLALVAVTLAVEVGIDVENVRPGFATAEIAERYFSLEEQAELRSLPDELRTEAFFHCWTRKEAFLKARGQGLATPLDCFSVSLTPGLPVVLRSTDAPRWHMFSFYPGPDVVAALVAEGTKPEIQFWEWQNPTNRKG